MLKDIEQSNEERLETVLPMMVLDVFAIELLLKSIIIMSNQNPPKTHRLNKLFKMIPHKQQRSINDLWEARVRPQIEGFAKEKGHPSDLSNALARCADAYHQLRYAHETREVTYYLMRLPSILMEVIGDLQPDWIEWQDQPTQPKRPPR